MTTRYLVDNLNPTGYVQVLEEVVGGAVQRAYTYGVQRISQNQLIASAWTPSFYGYDGHGSVRLLTDTTGTVTDTYDYDAFGNVVNATGSTPNNYLYSGEQFDPNLGLYYLRARYYNPTTGRFLTSDTVTGNPTKPITLHKYMYAEADPVNRVDPTGRQGEYALVVGGIAIPGTAVAVLAGSIAVACFGEPIVAGIGAAALFASGYEIYNVQATGTCPRILTFSWRERVEAIPRPRRDVEPSRCTADELDRLEKLRVAACKAAKRRCKGTDSCLTLGLKIVDKVACINARIDVLVQCYDGGDLGHVTQLDQLAVEIGDCIGFKATCKP